MPNNGFLDWDSPISADDEFTILEPGDYDFEVTKLEKKRAKSSGAPMATLTLRVFNDSSSTTIQENLVLLENCEWKISQFFRSIGQKQVGETIIPDWGKVMGSSGRCKVIEDTYTNRDGKERVTNRVERFYDSPAKAKEPVVDDELPW